MERTAVCPQEWEDWVICPLYKVGPQSDPVEYRPVCFLSHIRKFIDAAMLSVLNELFTPSITQFGFLEGLSVRQALFEAKYNAKAGLRHAAVPELGKRYGKLDSKIFLELMKEWIDPVEINRVRALLVSLRIRLKSDTTN